MSNTKIRFYRIYDDVDIDGFKQVLISKVYPGINTCLELTYEGKILWDGVDINEYGEIKFGQYIERLFQQKGKDCRGIRFFGTFTGKSILQQRFLDKEFVFYVYAAFDSNTNRWLLLEELGNFRSEFLEVPVYFLYNNHYNSIRRLFFENEIDSYGLLIQPHPEVFIHKAIGPIFILFEDPYYLEKGLVDQKNRDFSIPVELSRLLNTEIINFARCCNIRLEHLNDGYIGNFQDFISKRLNQKREDEVVAVDEQSLNVAIRWWFIDFLVFLRNRR